MADNSKFIWDFLLNQGFNKIGVSAIMGNLQCESGFLPNNLQNTYNNSFNMSDDEYTNSVDNGSYTNFIYDSAGYGLAQWTFWSRKRDLLNYAKSKGKSIGDLTTQLEFLVKELKESFPSLFTFLKNATSISSATSQFMVKFEMPADQSASAQKIRINCAQVIYNKYVNSTTTGETNSILDELSTSNILIQIGSTGTNVKILQENLIKLGFSCGVDGADGDFGNNTFKAVVNFQKKYKLEVDGVAGPETFACLSKEIKKIQNTSNLSQQQSSTKNIKVGDNGDNVKQIQSKLISLGYSCGPDGADGDFGNNTKLALIKFQQDNNLSATGIVDENTYNKLMNAVVKAPSTNSNAIQQLLDIARSQIGYLEKTSNNQLDDFTANAGANNWTKYARDLSDAGYYNGNKNGCAWCDVFCDWCFYILTNKNSVLAQQIQCQTGDCGAGCIFSAQYYRAQGCYSNTPQPGDQIFFGTTGAEYHTGIVEQVSPTQVITIEGNTSEQVARRTYSINDSSINGYGHPKYNLLTNSTTQSNQ